MPQTNSAVLEIAKRATPIVADAILQASAGDYDEEFWIGILTDADGQYGQTAQLLSRQTAGQSARRPARQSTQRPRSFDDFGDLMDMLAFHSRWLQRGTNSLVRSQAISLHDLHTQALSGRDVQPTMVAWFQTTLNLLLEAPGVEGDQEPTKDEGDEEPDYVPEPLRGPVDTLTVSGVEVRLE